MKKIKFVLAGTTKNLENIQKIVSRRKRDRNLKSEGKNVGNWNSDPPPLPRPAGYIFYSQKYLEKN